MGNINNINERPIFDSDKLDKIKQLLNKVKDIKKSEKDALINIFETLVDTDNNNIFVEKSIMYYTGESKFCYLFNMMMRSFEPGLAHFAYYMTIIIRLNKYVKENPDKSFPKDMKLYRRLFLTKIEFYLYKINLGHIICFASLNSKSLEDINFTPKNVSQSVSSNYSDKK